MQRPQRGVFMEKKDLYISVYRIINKYNAKTKQPKTFGTTQPVCGSEAQVLDVVAHGEALTASMIAAILGITKGAVSQTLAKLEKKGLISREGGANATIYLTDAGREILVNYFAYRDCRLRKVIAAAQTLPEESALVILNMLEDFEEALDQY